MAVTSPTPPVSSSPPRTKKRGCFSYVMGGIIVLFVVMFWMLWTVASTGLIRVPVFSSFAFRAPAPTHVVEPSRKDFSVWFQETLAEESRRQARLHVINRNVTLVIPEDVLTSLVRTFGASEDAKEVPIDFSRAQVAALETQLEVFLPVSGTSTAVVVRIIPTLDDEGFQLDIEELHVGSWRMPKFVLNALVRQVVRLGEEEVVASLRSVMELEAMSVTAEGLSVQGELIPGLLPL